jgi:hypothetical protein
MLCLSLCLQLILLGSAQATEALAGAWRSDYEGWEEVCTKVLDAATNCILCHTEVPGLNPYGQDIFDFGFGWFALEWEDSDGDGRLSGDEIRLDCTLPGDATSPDEPTSWSRIKALYN